MELDQSILYDMTDGAVWPALLPTSGSTCSVHTEQFQVLKTLPSISFPSPFLQPDSKVTFRIQLRSHLLQQASLALPHPQVHGAAACILPLQRLAYLSFPLGIALYRWASCFIPFFSPSVSCLAYIMLNQLSMNQWKCPWINYGQPHLWGPC